MDCRSFEKRMIIVLEKRNMSQRELAKLIGITEVTMSRYINGERIPNITILTMICKVLNISADWLLGLV